MSLFWKYFLLIFGAVCAALVISSAVGLRFSYQENKAAIASLQREKALAAAARIEQFVLQIEQQLAFVAVPQFGAENLEQRRLEFLKLQRVARGVTDIAQIDARGREQLSVSRLKMDEMEKYPDRSKEPAFRNARSGQIWYGPVYFRKETEPYMQMALRSGESGPVIVADVNLKFIWDVVTLIKIGKEGKAYVVDATGHLIAHPEIGLVLRKTDLSALEQVKAAFQDNAGDDLAVEAHDLAGHRVLAAHAAIEPAREQPGAEARASRLGWKVVVEQPVSEVYGALDATLMRTGMMIIAGLLLSALAALYLARSMVKPISTLQEGAQRIGAGDLDSQIEVRTGDELEALAGQFNRMTGQLRESYAGLERKVDARTSELKETLDQQTATSEILKVISSSTTDTQPVFDAIVQSGRKLFPDAAISVALPDRDHVRLVAIADGDPVRASKWRKVFPFPLRREYMHALAILDGRVVDMPDAAENTDDSLRQGVTNFLASGFRAMTVMPMMRGDVAIGAISVVRSRPGALSEKQIALLRTFADQAVIAIENARLFNETKEALERQTATAEILKVIASSPSDVQPVFDAIAASAMRIIEGHSAIVTRLEGDVLRLAAFTSTDDAGNEILKSVFPQSVSRGTGNLPRAIRQVAPSWIADTESDPDLSPELRAMTRARGYRSQLAVPMVRNAEVIGGINVTRRQPGTFSDHHIELLQTFADQAVIAIENVRLFNETKESLEQQTATSEILRVISDSPGDVKPILDAVAERATRLCESAATGIYVLEGETLRRTAFHGAEELQGRETLPYSPGALTGKAIAEGKPIHIEDLERVQAEFPMTWELAQRFGRHQTMLAVPLMREGRPFGTMFLRRTEVRPFSERQIALSTVFADQAAIGIENVRLFNETKEALEQQKASGEVLGAISSSIADTKPVFDKILEGCERLFEGHYLGVGLAADDGFVHVVARRGVHADLMGIAPIPISRESGSGLAIVERRIVHVPDVFAGKDTPPILRRNASKAGLKSMIFAPMFWEDRVIGTIYVGRTFAGAFTEKQIALLKTFANQAVIAIQNARLFKEIQEKSAQLEVANKHKSDFLANMSHELRTPLNAIIGFSEVLSERMFGEVNEKQADYLKDIHESGKHLLSLINDILDLSKIEAGRMDLELSSFDLPTALSNAMTLVRGRAQRHGIALNLNVDSRLGAFQADERKFKQIVLNLLSNAVKFTPDGGRVDVSAKLRLEHVEVAVRDTGIGIAPEDQAMVFEEFKQVGRDAMRKAEGTGLGLALTKRFIELHGGEIRLESAPGQGSTFTFTLPVR